MPASRKILNSSLGKIDNLTTAGVWAVVWHRLVEWSLPKSKICSSNSAYGNFLSVKLYGKDETDGAFTQSVSISVPNTC